MSLTLSQYTTEGRNDKEESEYLMGERIERTKTNLLIVEESQASEVQTRRMTQRPEQLNDIRQRLAMSRLQSHEQRKSRCQEHPIRSLDIKKRIASQAGENKEGNRIAGGPIVLAE